MIEIRSNESRVSEEREPIFSIDGVQYTIPKEVGGEVALEAMELARTMPDAAVSAWATERLIGKEGWKALRSVKGLDPAVVPAIMRICRERIFGGMEEEGKG